MGIKDRLRQLRIETDTAITPTTRLEVNHLEQVHNGGANTKENLFALTMPEHALFHKIEGDLATDQKEKTETILPLRVFWVDLAKSRWRSLCKW